jgi:hypothetical protein
MTILKQSDPRWADATIGATRLTLKAKGCVITSCSMLDSYFDPKEFKFPDELAKKLKFTPEGLLIWESLAKVTPFKLEKRLRTYDEAAIDDSLKDPKKGVILEVNNGQHFVLGLRRIPWSKSFWVADPLTGTKRLYSNVTGSAHMVVL